MSTTTTNYGLIKPAATDNYDIAVPNGNMDKIDAQLKTNADEVTAIKVDYTRGPGYAVDTGTQNALIVTLNPAPTAYVDGMRVIFKIANTNTVSSPTININFLGAKTIVRVDGTALAVGELVAGITYELFYDGTYFRLLGVSKAYIDTTFAVKSSVKTATLTSAGWVGSSAPYTQEIAATGLLASSNGIINLAQSATQAGRNAAVLARLNPTSQRDGYITITADGTKPTVDISIAVLILG